MLLFKQDCASFEDELGEGQPETVVTLENSAAVKKLVKDLQITVSEIQGILNTGKGNIKGIFKKHLEYQVMCSFNPPHIHSRT